MKKITLLFVPVLVACLLVSCKKENTEPYAYWEEEIFDYPEAINLVHIYTNVEEPLFEMSEMIDGVKLLNYSKSNGSDGPYNLRLEFPENTDTIPHIGFIYVKDAHLWEDSTVWLPIEISQKGRPETDEEKAARIAKEKEEQQQQQQQQQGGA